MAKSYATTYCDGSRPGCTWSGTEHYSKSTRSAQYRGGGRVYDFQDDYGVAVSAVEGWGMPEVKAAGTEYAILPGGQVQHIKPGMRLWQLVFEESGGSLTSLHTARDYLIEAFKPDRVSPPQPVRLQYTGATTTVEIDAWYVGGLEGSLEGDQGVMEKTSARLLSPDPYWYNVFDAAATLDSSLTIADADYVMKRIDGLWSNVSTQFNGTVRALARGLDGSIYIGGSFTDVGDANGDYIVKLGTDGTLSSLGTGTNGAVQAIIVAGDGTIYVGGSFALAGGVANTSRIASWNGLAWSALGTGAADNGVYCLVIGQDGTLYAGGDFSLMGGVANTVGIASWNGAAWSAMGTGLQATGGGGRTAYALACGLDGSIYVAGEFATVGGVANTPGVARWNGSAWVAMGTGIDASACDDVGRALAISPSGEVYLGGEFISVGGVTVLNVAMWNGSGWYPLGVGLGTSAHYVYALAFDETGTLYAGGSFIRIGSSSSMALWNYMSIWNGSVWTVTDQDEPGHVYAILPYRNSLYIGYSAVGTGYGAGQTTVANAGSRTAYPRIHVVRDGGTAAKAGYLRNETTGHTLYFFYSLMDDEEIIIDLDYQRDPVLAEAKTAGRKRITSSFFGDVVGRVLMPGSDFAAFGLASGSNVISLYVDETGAPTVTAWLEWRESYWSPDGAVS